MSIEDVFAFLQRGEGLISTLGIRFALEGAAIHCAMRVGHGHLGGPGVAHGGALAALLDTALGAEVLRYAIPRGKLASTVEMKVNFLRPAPAGAELRTSTQIQSKGQSLLVISGEAVDQDSGAKVAFAVGTFNLYEGELSVSTRA